MGFLSDLFETIIDHIKANPLHTAKQICISLAIAIPSAILTAILGVLGFSSLGPVGGKQALLPSPAPRYSHQKENSKTNRPTLIS